jgi:hypothetical protein
MKIHEVIYPNDALSIDACQHVWVDHNEFYSKIGAGITVDTYDGLLDIKNGSRYVTISWNYLHDHMKCSLIGHTDNTNQLATDTLIRVTYHHNWFSHTDGRNPSLRFGAVHMFNNMYEDITDYGLAARDGAHAKAENNHYHNVVLPMSTDKFPVTGLPNGYICQSGNLFTGTCGANVISQTGCEFWDSTALPYSYFLEPAESVESLVKMFAGLRPVTSVEEVGAAVPTSFALQQNYPNPFNPSTTISFSVGTYNHTSLRVYDLLGREVATLFQGMKQAGTYSITWDARNYPSGIYFYRLQSGLTVETKRMVLIK